MAQQEQRVSEVRLTEEMRKKIAEDLGLADRMEKVPERITIVGVRSADIGHKGPLPAVMVNT